MGGIRANFTGTSGITGTMAEHDTLTNDLNPPSGGFDQSRLRPVLLIFDQNKLHEWYMIVRKDTRVGREQGVEIEVSDDTVSRIHARIHFENIDRPNEEPICVLQDNESRNGTFLNGKRTAAPTRLKNGDRVFIGNTCLAYFLRTELEINTDQKLRAMATTDALTGLMNRGYMAIQYQKEIDRARRYMRPLTVLMIDLDDFKKVNDTYGHHVGDEVLDQFAKLIVLKIRVHDSAARYGGEEFAVLLPETNAQGALVIAERLRKTIESSAFATKAATLHLTASIGLAEINLLVEESLEELIRRADMALLEAKRRGKNMVYVNEVGV